MLSHRLFHGLKLFFQKEIVLINPAEIFNKDGYKGLSRFQEALCPRFLLLNLGFPGTCS